MPARISADTILHSPWTVPPPTPRPAAPLAVVAHLHAIRLDQQAGRRLVRQIPRRLACRVQLRHRAPLRPSYSVPSRSACVRNVSLPTATPVSSSTSTAASRNVVSAATRPPSVPTRHWCAGVVAGPTSDLPHSTFGCRPHSSSVCARRSAHPGVSARCGAVPPLRATTQTTPRAGAAWWARLRIRAGRRRAHHAGQHRPSLRAPGVQHPLLVHCQARVSVLAHMRRQPAGKCFHRWYDLRWKVGQIQHPEPSLRPARVCPRAGRFVIRPRYPALPIHR